jgi:recombination protein RecA
MPQIAGQSVQRARELIQHRPRNAGPRWSRSGLSGNLVELIAGPSSASLSVAAALILQSQRAGEFVAWISTKRDSFFPPDFADRGIDLTALPVVWAPEPDGDGNRSAHRACRAAEHLLRSGAFGCVVIDLADHLQLAVASQGRLLRLAEHHDAVVLVLRRKRKSGRYAGSLVSVRAESVREQMPEYGLPDVAPFRIIITSTKDKREGPGWTAVEHCNGPPGMH